MDADYASALHSARSLVRGMRGDDPFEKWDRKVLLPFEESGKTGEWRWAVPQSLLDVMQGVMSPGKALRGEYELAVDPASGRVVHKGMAEDAGTLAGALAGTGAVTAPLRGSGLGIFGGVMAKTADKEALKLAQKMAEDGASRDEIWQATGWFKGKDGKWRFEIPDEGSTIGDKALSELSGDTGASGATQRRASGVLWHSPLYEAYPELRGIDIDARYNNELKGSRGRYSYPDGNGGRPAVMTETNALYGPQGTHGVLLHELQHAVQDREGFGRGASVEEYAHGPMFDRKANDLKAELSRSIFGSISMPPHEVVRNLKYGDQAELRQIAQRFGFETVDEAVAFLKQQDELRTPFSQYQRTSGEVEARNVQARMKMPAEERRSKAPWLTQDTPDELQIVRMRGSI
jgi:hypothetical protein